MTALVHAARREAPSSGTALRSAVYAGTLRHRRFGPDVTHDFSYRVAMPFLYLDEVDSVAALHPLWSTRRPAPVRFRREDFIGDRAIPLRTAVLDRVAGSGRERPGGAVAMLANLRTWGWLFNPISLYYCEGEDGAFKAVVAEVENTPWHERCSYVVGAPGRHRFAKAMHVSPFLPMDVDYELFYTAPGEALLVHLNVLRADKRLFSATLSLRREGLDRRALGRLLWAHPALTHRISAGIYTQAARLKLRRAKFYAHPDRGTTRTGRPGTPVEGAGRRVTGCPAGPQQRPDGGFSS